MSSLSGELLRTLVGVDNLGKNASKGREDSKASRFKDTTHQGASETAGSRRQERVKAMEESKGLVSGMDGAAALSLTPHLGELLAVALRLTEDADFKIVRGTFQENYFVSTCLVGIFGVWY